METGISLGLILLCHLGLDDLTWFFVHSEYYCFSGAEDFTPEQDVEEVRQIEKQVKRRFAIGTQVM